jgi:hypothetical protein
MFFQDRYLIDNIDVLLKLKKSKDSFCLMGDGKREYKLTIDKAILYTRQVKVSDNVRLAHAQILEKSTIKYPIRRVETKSVTIPQNISNTVVDNQVYGALPKRIVFAFVDCDSFDGNYKKNPFNFKHHNIREIHIKVNNTDVPFSPVEMDFANNLYLRAYYTQFTGIDKAPLDFGNSISKDDFSKGYSVFAFDLTPDMCNGEHINLVKKGTLSMTFKFSKPLDAPLSLVLYFEYENIIEINRSRNIITDFTSS